MAEGARAPGGGARCWLVAPANLLARGVARLPQGALLATGRMLHALARPLLRSRRRIAARNIALCFPQLDAQAQAALVEATMRDSVIGVLESLKGWFGRDRDLRELFTVEGLEHLRVARAGGRGALVVAAHWTHVELAARLMTLALREPTTLIGRRHNDPCMERFLKGARASGFSEMIDKKDGRSLVRALSSGAAVFWAGDQDFNYRNAFVPFFGVAAATVSVMTQLGQRADAAVVPLSFERGDDGRYRMTFWPEWKPLPPAEDAARYMAWLEQRVRRHPSQYLWVHRRFKTRPPGEPDLYARDG